MISQKCPKCYSSRIRRGYRPTPLWLKLLFRYHLLCDNCNWEFTGFAVPGTVSSKPTKSPKKSTTGKLNPELINKNTQQANETTEPIVSLDHLAAQNAGAEKKAKAK